MINVGTVVSLPAAQPFEPILFFSAIANINQVDHVGGWSPPIISVLLFADMEINKYTVYSIQV